VSEWISVKDRLPEENQRCLTWCGEPLACSPGTEILIGRFYKNDADGEDPDGWGFSFYKQGFLGGYEITHWMPLPAPPTDQGEAA
jgi:hypothetical protein